jgi:hypothetical protein
MSNVTRKGLELTLNQIGNAKFAYSNLISNSSNTGLGIKTQYLYNKIVGSNIFHDYDLCLKILKTSGAAKSAEIYAVMEPNGRTDNSLVQMHREKLIIRSRHFAKLHWLRPISWSWMYLALTKSSLKVWVRKLRAFASLTET